MRNRIDHAAESNGRFEAPGIVSVNARGAAGGDLGRKLAFLVAVIALLIIAAVWGLNHWRDQRRAERLEAGQSASAENRPAQVAQRRVFEERAAAPTPMPNAAPGAAAAPTAPGVAPCKEVVVLDSHGQPIPGKDGAPIRIGCDGKIVPAIDPRAAPPVTTAPSASASPAPAGSAARPPSRYGGDVLIPAQPVASGPSAGSGPGAPAVPVPPGLDLPGAVGRRPELAAPSATPADAPDALMPTATGRPGLPLMGGASLAAGVPNQQGAVGSLLTPTPTPKITAAKIGDRNLLLAKGAQIDCALTTRVVSEVSGFASCVLTSHVYSDNGKVVLLERGSDVQGEYTAAIQQGQRRLFVLWTRVKTPHGVVLALDSPAADGLGTMGLAGHVDNRWWERVGAAFLLSVIKDAIALQAVRSSSGTGSTVAPYVFQNTSRTGDQMAERILASTINIKPTIYKHQGDRASIFVARDMDFSTVYALRAD